MHEVAPINPWVALAYLASGILFILALRGIATAAKSGDGARFAGAPYFAPRSRLDETRAARQPVLSWKG